MRDFIKAGSVVVICNSLVPGLGPPRWVCHQNKPSYEPAVTFNKQTNKQTVNLLKGIFTWDIFEGKKTKQNKNPLFNKLTCLSLAIQFHLRRAAVCPEGFGT